MVTDFFGSLLEELGRALQLPGLRPDANNTCLIRFKGDFYVQLEMDRTGQYLIIGSDLGAVQAGKYRENLLHEALKANGMPYPRNGTLAFSKQADHLILFEMLNIKELNGAKIMERLNPFMEKAKIWKDAISKGNVPVVTAAGTTAPSMGMFGLRP